MIRLMECGECVVWAGIKCSSLEKKWKWSQWELAFSRNRNLATIQEIRYILHEMVLHFTIHSMSDWPLSMGCFRCICTLVVVNDVDEWCRLECLNWPISWYFDSSLPMVVRHYFPSAINLVSNVNTINYYCPTCWLCYSVSLPVHTELIRFVVSVLFQFPFSDFLSRVKVKERKNCRWVNMMRTESKCIEVCVCSFRSKVNEINPEINKNSLKIRPFSYAIQAHRHTLSITFGSTQIHQNHKKEDFSFIDAHTNTLTHTQRE